MWGRSLQYSYNVALTVFKLDGVWQAEETPAVETLEAADRFLSGSGPQTIDDATAAELIAAGIGTCTQLT